MSPAFIKKESRAQFKGTALFGALLSSLLAKVKPGLQILFSQHLINLCRPLTDCSFCLGYFLLGRELICCAVIRNTKRLLRIWIVFGDKRAYRPLNILALQPAFCVCPVSPISPILLLFFLVHFDVSPKQLWAFVPELAR